MAAMDELETLLQSLAALKPPGVTKTKIDAITAKCVENVQSDSTIVQKVVQQFRNSPVTHKLGVLYVVDSVTRQWVEKARAAGQAVSKNASPGTFASGVQKVTDVLPELMSDLVQTAPDNQKDKISKLLDIWERGQTFPLNMLAGFKHLLSASQKTSYTPPGSPPKGVSTYSTAKANPQPVSATVPVVVPVTAPAADTSALLAVLANQNHGQNGHTNAAPAPLPVPTYQNLIAPPPPTAFFPPPLVPAPPQPFVAQPTVGNDVVQQIIAALAAGVINQDQALAVLHALAAGQQAQLNPQTQLTQQPGASLPIPPLPQPTVVAPPPTGPQNGIKLERYEQNGSVYRDRSRSPEYRRRQSPNRRSPPNRRDSPTYGVYDPNAGPDGSQNRNDRDRGGGRGGRGRNRGRGRDGRDGRDEYRQRTPPSQRRQPSPGANAPHNDQGRFLQWDNSLGPEQIRVLSRTLFVGGAGGTEGEIRAIFSRFGKVQTCIVNQEKRHAFVKMVNRHDALAAKKGMDSLQDANALAKARQTRWGVGFGPRDCSDYTNGVSVIPISRLTDADRKWVLTAEYGGTGGRPLEGGMVIEEPDIEIGAGVSSKAISRRVPPEPGRGRGGGGGGGGGGGRGHDHGHGHGPGHNHGPRGGGNFDKGPRFRAPDRPQQHHQHQQQQTQEPRHYSAPRTEPPNVAVPPAVPGFGFQLPGL